MPHPTDERIRRWRVDLALRHGLLKRELDELEDHLRADLQHPDVLHDEHAVQNALARLGDSRQIAKELRKSRKLDLLHSAIGTCIVAFFIVTMALLGGRWGVFIDIPSLVLLLGVVGGGLWMTYRPARVMRALGMGVFRSPPRDLDEIMEARGVFRRGRHLCWAVGVLGTLLGTIQMLADLSNPHAIGAGLAVALLTTLYGALTAELFFAPMLQTMQQRRDQIETVAAIA